VKLIKQVPGIAHAAKAVGIVHPLSDGRKMDLGSVGIFRAPGVDFRPRQSLEVIAKRPDRDARLRNCFRKVAICPKEFGGSGIPTDHNLASLSMMIAVVFSIF
jgi:hypothetical protein